jgi:hypothetical protein
VVHLFDAEDEGASKRPTDISELPILENKNHGNDFPKEPKQHNIKSGKQI